MADPSASEHLESFWNVVESASIIRAVCESVNTTSPWSLQRNWVDGMWKNVSALMVAFERCMDRKRLKDVFSKAWTTR
jgi:reverse gyrase